MQKTNISYLTHTWNPIGMKCTPISEGCKNCWHLDIINRFGLINEGLRTEELNAPLKRRKPARIGVQFMGDLFHKSVPFERIDKVIWVIEKCHLRMNGHIFLLLTKRIQRAFKYFQWHDEITYTSNLLRRYLKKNPLPNLWIGVSVENKKTVDRIDNLRQTPAAVRFVSFEPLLEDLGQINLDGVDWGIVGSESGSGRRPCKNEWVDNIVAQCKSAGIPGHVKQIYEGNKKIIDPKEYPQEYPRTR